MPAIQGQVYPGRLWNQRGIFQTSTEPILIAVSAFAVNAGPPSHVLGDPGILRISFVDLAKEIRKLQDEEIYLRAFTYLRDSEL